MRFLGTLLVLLAGSAPLAATELHIGTGERLLVVAPHPDDETLGAGGLIQRVLANGGTAHVVLMTAGDGYHAAVEAESRKSSPPPARYIAYGSQRFKETQRAVRVLGGDRAAVDLLGFPDGELASLLESHWSLQSPAVSHTTARERPPYPEALDRQRHYAGLDLRNALIERLEAVQPTLIALPDWLDEHADHSATATFVLLALERWRHEHPHQAAPRLLAYLIHWHAWPQKPWGWDGRVAPLAAEALPLLPPQDLPARYLAHATLTLSDAEITEKRDALGQFATQLQVNPYLLNVFVRRNEPFVLITPTDFPRVQNAIRRPPAVHGPSRG